MNTGKRHLETRWPQGSNSEKGFLEREQNISTQVVGDRHPRKIFCTSVKGRGGLTLLKAKKPHKGERRMG